MKTRLAFQILIGILAAGCAAPTTARSGNASGITRVANTSPIQTAKPTETIPAPASFLGQYKIYNFDTGSDFGFNQKWFFQAKGAGERASTAEFQGELCFKARETKGIIREWGQSVKGEWIAFEQEPWKKVGDVWGLGVCLSASRLRELAEWGGMRTAEVVGIGAQERVAPVPTHPPVAGVEQKFWTNIWSCNFPSKGLAYHQFVRFSGLPLVAVER